MVVLIALSCGLQCEQLLAAWGMFPVPHNEDVMWSDFTKHGIYKPECTGLDPGEFWFKSRFKSLSI